MQYSPAHSGLEYFMGLKHGNVMGTHVEPLQQSEMLTQAIHLEDFIVVSHVKCLKQNDLTSFGSSPCVTNCNGGLGSFFEGSGPLIQDTRHVVVVIPASGYPTRMPLSAEQAKLRVHVLMGTSPALRSRGHEGYQQETNKGNMVLHVNLAIPCMAFCWVRTRCLLFPCSSVVLLAAYAH